VTLDKIGFIIIVLIFFKISHHLLGRPLLLVINAFVDKVGQLTVVVVIIKKNIGIV